MNKNLLARAALLVAPLLNAGCDRPKQDVPVHENQRLTRAEVNEALEAAATPPATTKTEDAKKEETPTFGRGSWDPTRLVNTETYTDYEKILEKAPLEQTAAATEKQEAQKSTEKTAKNLPHNPLSNEEAVEIDHAKKRIALMKKALEIDEAHGEFATASNRRWARVREYDELQKELSRADRTDAFGDREFADLKQFIEQNGKEISASVFATMLLHSDKSEPPAMTISADKKTIHIDFDASFQKTAYLEAPHSVRIACEFNKSELTKFSVKMPGDSQPSFLADGKIYLQTIFVPASVKVSQEKMPIDVLSPVRSSQSDSPKTDQPVKAEK